MLDDPTGIPVFSFVAEQNDGLVGHVLFSSVKLEPGRRASAQILAPLAVARDRQQRGLGTRLVEHGLAKLKEAEVELVFVQPRSGRQKLAPGERNEPQRVERYPGLNGTMNRGER